MKISLWLQIKLLQLSVHIAAVVGLVYLFDPIWLIATFVSWLVMYFYGGSIGVHRLWTHKAFETSSFVRYSTLAAATIAGLGSVIGWAGQHRMHHANSDVSIETDPYWAHDYTVWGTFKAWVMVPRSVHFRFSTVKDLAEDKWVMFTHNYYLQIIVAWVTLLLLIDPKVALYCWAIPSALGYSASQVTSVWGHRKGFHMHDTDDLSVDNHWRNIFSLGESYQNTHHKYPTQIIMGKYDLSGYIIDKFLKKKDSF